jgi:hypothetical protein
MRFIEVITIGTIVTLSWIGLEMIILGCVNPNNVDTVIAIILTYSLYMNLEYWKKNR